MLAPFSTGTIFAGRYRIIKNLASGGMGTVYEAVHVQTNRRKALKIMHPHLFQNTEMRERFMREARISAEIESEFIVDVSDAGVDDACQMPFLVMELLHGEELSHRLKRLGRFTPAETVTFLHQIALALDKTHAADVIHRDLKPENLFWTQREDGSPRLKILDFGVAKLIDNGANGGAATQVLGTPLYMAPEQFCADIKLSGAVDIYALGMMTYELLVGEKYWSKETKRTTDLMAFVLMASKGPQESAVQRAATAGVILPPAFDAWFARMTAFDPRARFERASDAARALASVFEVARGADFSSTVVLPETSGFSTESFEISQQRATLPETNPVHHESGSINRPNLADSKIAFAGSTALTSPLARTGTPRSSARWAILIMGTLSTLGSGLWVFANLREDNPPKTSPIGTPGPDADKPEGAAVHVSAHHQPSTSAMPSILPSDIASAQPILLSSARSIQAPSGFAKTTESVHSASPRPKTTPTVVPKPFTME